jgi:hypothetical protein
MIRKSENGIPAFSIDHRCDAEPALTASAKAIAVRSENEEFICNPRLNNQKYHAKS